MPRWLRWAVPAVPMTLGLAVVFAGFVYDVLFAGIPYQDPTPELQARYRHHAGVASAVRLTGSAILAAGLVVAAAVGVWSLARRRV